MQKLEQMGKPDFPAKFSTEPAANPELVAIPLPPIDSSALPHMFVGTVSIDFFPAMDGAEVTLWTDGYSEPLAKSRVSDGTYTLLVPQYGFNSFEGRSLLFKVDNLTAEPTASWSAGGADLLDLKVITD